MSTDVSGLMMIGEARAVLVSGQHEYETRHAGAIADTWQRLKAANPALYNGRTVLAENWSVEGGVFSAVCREVNYATLLHFLMTPAEAGAGAAPGTGALYFYAAPAIISADGKAIMGRMASHTANAGRVYFPSGSLEIQDFAGGMADFGSNMRREVLEETGIDLATANAATGYHFWQERGVAALIRDYRFADDAQSLRRRMLDFCGSSEGDGELDDILVFSPGECDSAMPGPIRAWMSQFAG
ncbi:MAG: hypothetical protein R3D32_01810 [Nitratireductor sp.]